MRVRCANNSKETIENSVTRPSRNSSGICGNISPVFFSFCPFYLFFFPPSTKPLCFRILYWYGVCGEGGTEERCQTFTRMNGVKSVVWPPGMGVERRNMWFNNIRKCRCRHHLCSEFHFRTRQVFNNILRPHNFQEPLIVVNNRFSTKSPISPFHPHLINLAARIFLPRGGKWHGGKWSNIFYLWRDLILRPS